MKFLLYSHNVPPSRAHDCRAKFLCESESDDTFAHNRISVSLVRSDQNKSVIQVDSTSGTGVPHSLPFAIDLQLSQVCEGKTVCNYTLGTGFDCENRKLPTELALIRLCHGHFRAQSPLEHGKAGVTRVRAGSFLPGNREFPLNLALFLCSSPGTSLKIDQYGSLREKLRIFLEGQTMPPRNLDEGLWPGIWLFYSTMSARTCGRARSFVACRLGNKNGERLDPGGPATRMATPGPCAMI